MQGDIGTLGASYPSLQCCNHWCYCWWKMTQACICYKKWVNIIEVGSRLARQRGPFRDSWEKNSRPRWDSVADSLSRLDILFLVPEGWKRCGVRFCFALLLWQSYCTIGFTFVKIAHSKYHYKRLLPIPCYKPLTVYWNDESRWTRMLTPK